MRSATSHASPVFAAGAGSPRPTAGSRSFPGRSLLALRALVGLLVLAGGVFLPGPGAARAAGRGEGAGRAAPPENRLYVYQASGTQAAAPIPARDAPPPADRPPAVPAVSGPTDLESADLLAPDGLEGLPPLPGETEVTRISSGPVLEVSLQEAIGRALDANPGLDATEDDIGAARWRYYQQRAQLHPRLSAVRAYTSQTRPPSLGGTFAIGAGEVNQRRVQLDQTIFTSGRQHHALRQRRHETESSRDTWRNAQDDLIFQVKQSFYAILLQQVSAENARQSLAELETQYDQALARYEAGAATQFDVLLARSQLANARPPLIRALHTLEVESQRLLGLMGIDASVPLGLVGGFDQDAVLPPFEVLLAGARQNRHDLRSLRDQLAAAHRSVKSLRANHYPLLTGNASHDRTQGARFPTTRVVEINSVTVNLQVPVYDQGLSHAQAREAQARERRLQHQIRELELGIRRDLVEAYLRVQESREVVAAAREGLTAATRALADAQLGFEAGVRTSLEVLDAQTQLTTARSNLAQARHDLSVARARLVRVVAQAGPVVNLPFRG